MSQLLVDAGNSRVKWARLRAGGIGRVRAADWQARGPLSVERRLAADARGVTRVVVCSVAGAARERQLRAAARAAGLPAPVFIRTARSGAGVRNGYTEAWRLGADRWMALIGAHALRPRQALCIVDVGTALTIDLLDARGRHRGGLLVPGPALMVDALLGATAGIRRRAGGASRRARTALLARSTRAGLDGGSTLACAALIERVLADMRRELRLRPRLLLAGGGAAAIAPRLRTTHQRVDDLVLRGLAVLSANCG